MESVLSLINPAYTAAGFVVGALVGLSGTGGAALMTPLLMLLFGIHPATAVGTDLLYAGLTKIGGSVVHGAHGAIDWRVTRRLALGSVPAAAVTLAALSYFGLHSQGAGTAIKTSLGFALMLTAVSLVFHRRLQSAIAYLMEGHTEREIGALTTGVGVVLGALVSITSVGAGALGVPALMVLYPRMQTVRIVATNIAHAVPLALVAGAGYWWLGSVDYPLLASLLAGSIPGVVIGSHLASWTPEHVLRTLLAGILAFLGGKLAVG
jgi:uncharacterized protein